MRYLTENNDYKIMYSHSRYQMRVCPEGYRIGAYLEDKKSGKIYHGIQKIVNSDLEKGLMILGKRLIRKWQNRKK